MGILAMQALTPLACACTCMHGINYELASKVQSQHLSSQGLLYQATLTFSMLQARHCTMQVNPFLTEVI